MPPIKIKLSLSSASLAGLPAPSSQEKGKSKAISTPTISTPLTYSHQTPNSAQSEWEDDSPAPIAGPSRLSHVSLLGPAFSPHIPTPHDTVSGKTLPTSKPPAKTKSRAKVKTKFSRITKPKAAASRSSVPSAIPSHVYSGPPTPLSSPGQMAPPPMPHYPFPNVTTPSPAPESRSHSVLDSPGGWEGDISVKEEDEDMDGETYQQGGSPDPLSMPMTPGEAGEHDTPLAKGRVGVRWARTKKPMKEVMGKIMIELRRRDEYALFSEPVNTEDFPTYLSIIGGADKMMDLSTMQNKIDNGEYRSMDGMESDLRALVTAAQTFNPAGTVPYRSANNILTHGLKHIERARPLVITPSPSPTRELTGTPNRFQSVDIDSEAKQTEIEIPPSHRFPMEMLDFPPNSLPGLAVGWSVNGGKRQYIKRELRTREKFSGKWRHFDFDGTRALAEMDDIQHVLAPREPKKSRMVVDWRGMRQRDSWWDWSGVGGIYGQPPVPFTKYPIVPSPAIRELGAAEWGVYPDIQMERALLAQRRTQAIAATAAGGGTGDAIPINTADEDVLVEHLRPTLPKIKQVKIKKEGAGSSSGYLNTYEGRRPEDWLRDMADGDVRGEAYRTSVQKFLEGAVRSAEEVPKIKKDTDSTPTEDLINIDGTSELERYINHRYNNGVLSSEVDDVSPRVRLSLQQLKSSSSSTDTAQSTSTPIIPLSQIRALAESSHARITLRHLLRPTNPLDIAPFILAPEEFSLTGRHQGMDGGLGWVGSELERLTRKREAEKDQGKKRKIEAMEVDDEEPTPKRTRKEVENSISSTRAGSSPLSAAPSPTPHIVDNSKPQVSPMSEEAQQMKALRLEILALCKFFPLTGLKPLSKAQADRVLPQNVRALLSAPEA